MQSKDSKKIIFGLSSRATIINSIILVFISQLFWVMKFVQQLPLGADIKKFDFTDNVPWYFDMPFMILAITMGLSWVEYVYKLKQGEYLKRLLLLISLIAVEFFSKFILLILFFIN